MKLRETEKSDLIPLLTLYTQLHDNDMPAIDAGLEAHWNAIAADKNHHIIVGELDGKIVTSCVLVIIPNLTRNQRPYALIENVITDSAHRSKGYATAALNYAKGIAKAENCYKIMLMTGSKAPETLRFYENAGYNKNDKTAFIMWLK